MSWTKRDFRSYPSRFPASMREAVARLGTLIEFSAYNSREEAEADATSMRRYRWAIRSRPGVDRTLSSYLELYDFRSKVEETSLGVFILWFWARPTPLSDLLANNPEYEAIP